MPVIQTAGEWLESELCGQTGDVVLASPFLSRSVCAWLARASRDHRGTWTVLTRLDANAIASDYLSADGLRALDDAGVTIRDVGRLHAKCFVVGDKVFLGSGI